MDKSSVDVLYPITVNNSSLNIAVMNKYIGNVNVHESQV